MLQLVTETQYITSAMVRPRELECNISCHKALATEAA